MEERELVEHDEDARSEGQLRELLNQLEAEIKADSDAARQIIDDIASMTIADEVPGIGLSAKSDTLDTVLRCLPSTQDSNREAIIKLVRQSLQRGCDTHQTEAIFQLLERGCKPAWDLVADLTEAQDPPHFAFDIGTADAACLAFSGISKSFPPSRAGYSFSTWLRIDRSDVSCHRTIVSIYDRPRKMLIMLYLEKQSGQLVLQTGQRSSVMFEHRFEPDIWYNVVVVHRRPTGTSSSKASLYVNGRELEVLRVSFPSTAEELPFRVVLGQASASDDEVSMAATPTRMCLGHTMLVKQELSAELIRMYFLLGPARRGNYQDMLGDYLTYRASAEVNQALEAESKTSELRARNAENMPETQIVLAFDGTTLSTSAIDLLTVQAGTTMQSMADRTIKCIVPNAARPDTSIAIVTGDFGVLRGAVTSHHEPTFLTNMYRVDGIARLLRLVESASTVAKLDEALKLLFSSIASSWRNSDDMERMHGYEILAQHLKIRPEGFITAAVLRTILKFIGLEDEVLTNPLAYRFLIVDFGIWAKAQPDARIMHFDQFLVFSTSERHGAFNNRRLTKMNCVKKFLMALRQDVPADALSGFISALRILAANNFSTEVVRSLATFVVAAIFSPDSLRSGDRAALLEAAALSILDAIVDLLADEKAGPERQIKFAATVTLRWCLVLLKDPRTAKGALTILLMLLQTQGSSFTTRFRNHNNGFAISALLMKDKWRDGLWSPVLRCCSGQSDSFEGISDMTAVLDIMVKDLIKTVDRRARDAKLLKAENEARPATSDPATAVLTDADAFVDALCTLTAGTTLMLDAAFWKRVLGQLAGRGASFDYAIAETELGELEKPQSRPRSSTNGSAHAPPPGKADDGVSIKSNLSQTPRSPVRVRPRGLSLRRASSYIMVPGLAASSERSLLTLSRARPARAAQEEPLSLQRLRMASTRMIAASLLDDDDFEPLMLIVQSPASRDSLHAAQDDCLALVAREVQEQLTGDEDRLRQVRTVRNFTKFAIHLARDILDGQNDEAAGASFECIASTMTTLRSPTCAVCKAVQLCEQGLRTVEDLLRTIAVVKLTFAIYDIEESARPAERALTLSLTWQQILFGANDADFIRLIWYAVFQLLKVGNGTIKALCCDVLRCSMMHQAEQVGAIFTAPEAQAALDDVLVALNGLTDIAQTDNEEFLAWLDSHVAALDAGFDRKCLPAWNNFVRKQARLALERVNKSNEARKQYLRHFIEAEKRQKAVYHRHEHSIDNWLKNIGHIEAERARKSKQDAVDQDKFVSSAWQVAKDMLGWTTTLLKGQAPEDGATWRLDSTECRLQIRPKLRIDNHKVVPVKKRDDAANGHGPDPTGASLVSIQDTHGDGIDARRSSLLDSTSRADNVPDTPVDDAELDDKNRRVFRSLVHGEVIRSIFNVSRIVGLNVVEGLLIIGKLKLYLIDNYFMQSDGEVVDSSDGSADTHRDPILKALAAQAQGKGSATRTKGLHDCRTWSYTQLARATKRQFLFRNVALELGFTDGRSFLLTVEAADRDEIHGRLAERNRVIENNQSDTITKASQQTGLGSISRFFQDAIGQTPWALACKAWERRSISNFEYLMTVNSLAGRSFNDLTQYPVMPWILADYSSTELDLTKPETFRDLSKNMGSQTSARRKHFRERYESFAEIGDPNLKPFHFGTHYSSAMIVSSYLIRLVPFVESYLLLQGGRFDHPDRLFYSIEKAWLSASRDISSDVRELIPEFFYMPEFLMNLNGYDFGVGQTGQTVGDVLLPPWAKGSARVFVQKHREALECDYVSARLHNWIDLVFGAKQLGMAAVENTNVFHNLSYHGSVNVDSITDDVERAAAVGIIHNFGQTPRQVFTRPHQVRGAAPPAAFRFENNLSKLRLESFQAHAIQQRVGKLYVRGDTVLCLPANRVELPHQPHAVAQWSSAELAVRLLDAQGTSLGVCEGLHDEPVIAAASGRDVLIFASLDTTVSVWETAVRGNHVVLNLRGRLRGHCAPLSQVTCSDSFAMIVTGSADGIAMLWDMNRAEYVRTLHGSQSSAPRDHSQPVAALAINHINGHIATATPSLLRVFDVNGSLLASCSLAPEACGLAKIVALDFYEGRGGEWFTPRDILFTGHELGSAATWTVRLRDSDTDAAQTGQEQQSDSATTNAEAEHDLRWEIRQERILKHKRPTAAVTAFCTTGRQLFTGDAEGNVHSFSWRPTEVI